MIGHNQNSKHNPQGNGERSGVDFKAPAKGMNSKFLDFQIDPVFSNRKSSGNIKST